jgi:sensor histidine kinase YesM
MDKEKLDLLIQQAAHHQQQELSWVGNVFRQRLKELQETNEKMKEWEKNQKD